MSLLNAINIAATGMSAQTVRLNTTASNMANANVASSTPDTVYKPRHAIFETMRKDTDGASGVAVNSIREEKAPGRKEYNPTHPKADVNGYIYMPNVSVVDEMANMISASRSYQFNVEVANSAKQMLQRTLQLGQ